MSRGTPHVLKCPKCKRGKWRHPRAIKGVMVIGNETKLSRFEHEGHSSRARTNLQPTS